jgi:hypothetical protein
MGSVLRRRWWAWALGVAVIVLAGIWLLGPRLACAAVGARLPLDLGHDYRLTGASISPRTDPEAQATITLAPARARALANSLHRVWLPPGWPRAGLTLDGTGRLPKDLVDFDWRLVVAGAPAPRPTLRIRLTPEEADDLLSPYRRIPVAREQGLFMTWRIGEATVRDDDPPGHAPDQRRLRIDAIGEMRLEWHGRTWRVAVRHLAAHADWTFTTVPGGLRPSCRLAIDGVDASLPSLPFMRDWRSLWRRVEDGANRAFAKRLSKRTWPAGTPIDAAVDGRIGGALGESLAAR